jgi:hypothetical protein
MAIAPMGELGSPPPRAIPRSGHGDRRAEKSLRPSLSTIIGHRMGEQKHSDFASSSDRDYRLSHSLPIWKGKPIPCTARTVLAGVVAVGILLVGANVAFRRLRHEQRRRQLHRARAPRAIRLGAPAWCQPARKQLGGRNPRQPSAAVVPRGPRAPLRCPAARPATPLVAWWGGLARPGCFFPPAGFAGCGLLCFPPAGLAGCRPPVTARA